MSNLWQRIFTGIVFLAVMITGIVYSNLSLAIVFGIVSLLCAWEYYKLIKHKASPEPYSFFAGVIIIQLYAIFAVSEGHFHSTASLSLVIIVPFLLLFVEIFRNKENPFINASTAITGVFYSAVPFLILTGFSGYQIGGWEGRWFVLMFFLIIWINDIFAYIFGRLLGRHKLAPKISAGKTIEGMIGGMAFTLVVAYFAFPYLFSEKLIHAINPSEMGHYNGLQIVFTPVTWMGLVLITTLTAVFSDLLESKLKRMVGVKDSGNLLPGHGGFLDRFDSVLLSAPVIFVYLNLFTTR